MTEQDLARPRPEEEEVEEGVPTYFITYSDMMTLLFCFFVALLAMSFLVPERQAALTASIRQSFPSLLGTPRGASGGEAPAPIAPGRGRGEGAPGAVAPGEGTPGEGTVPAQPGAVDPDALYQSLQSRLADQGVEIVPQEAGVVIRINSALLFPLGSDRLHPEGERLLGDIARALKDLPGEIRVEGHTDDLPIHTPRFPSNWELSLARAARVGRAFIEVYGIDPRRIVLSGYADQRPLVPNDSPEHRQRNRRVEVYLTAGIE